MNHVPTVSIPMANRQDTQPAVVHIEYDNPSLVYVTTHLNKSSLIKDNNTRLVENVIELGKAEITPSCMDTCISDPDRLLLVPSHLVKTLISLILLR